MYFLLSQLKSRYKFGCVFVLVLTMTCFYAKENNQECGTVRTVHDPTNPIVLKEDIPLTTEQFEKLKIMKLKNATFSPNTERNCLIQVCGFTSFFPKLYSPLLGSDGDYMDCHQIKSERTANPDIYNDLFNTSSISCGCQKQKSGCNSNCEKKSKSLHSNKEQKWRKNQCAFLYSEIQCSDCYFNPIMLNETTIYIKDNSRHIRSIIVKPGCIVYQNLTAVKYYSRFSNSRGQFNYTSAYGDDNVKSAFHSDPETFWCNCKNESIVKTLAKSITKTPNDPSILSSDSDQHAKNNLMIEIALAMVSIGFIAALGSTTFLIISNRRKEAKDRDSYSVENLNLTNCTDCSGLLRSPTACSKIDTSWSDIQTETLIGEGHFGEVYLGNLKVAVKTNKKTGDNAILSLESLLHEKNILTHLGFHENVVRLLGANCDQRNGEVFLITEYCENGSLKEYLKTKVRLHIYKLLGKNTLEMSDDGYGKEVLENKINFTDEDLQNFENIDRAMFNQFLKWSEEIANGMSFITLKKVVHIDLAARNVLLTHNLTAKIGDFGLSRKIYVKNYLSNKQDAIPLLWIAPESLTKNEYSSKSDIWAYAMCLFEIFSIGEDPYNNMSIDKVLGSIIQGKSPDRPKYAPDDIYSVLAQCWNENPHQRPSFEYLREFFQNRQTCSNATEKSDTDIEIPIQT